MEDDGDDDDGDGGMAKAVSGGYGVARSLDEVIFLLSLAPSLLFPPFPAGSRGPRTGTGSGEGGRRRRKKKKKKNDSAGAGREVDYEQLRRSFVWYSSTTCLLTVTS